jgi:hypothetical protein
MKSSNQTLEPIGGKGRPPLAQFFVISMLIEPTSAALSESAMPSRTAQQIKLSRLVLPTFYRRFVLPLVQSFLEPP